MNPPVTEPAADPRPAERYGPPRSIGRRAIIVAAVLGLVATGVLGWGLYQLANPPVKAAMVSWTPAVDGRMEATIEVRRTVDSPISCDVVAVDDRLAEVGRNTIRVPADGRKHFRETVSIEVEGMPVAAELRGCSVE